MPSLGITSGDIILTLRMSTIPAVRGGQPVIEIINFEGTETLVALSGTGHYLQLYDITGIAVPEPSTYAILVGTGSLWGLTARLRRRRTRREGKPE